MKYDECPGYDTKQSDGEAPVMMELWGMQNVNYPFISIAPRVASNRVLTMGQIELFDI